MDVTGDKQATLERINQVLAGGVVPHNTALGLSAVDVGPGWVVSRLPYADKLVGNPETGVLHGGAITATLDAASGLAVFLKMKAPTRIATIDIRIDYMCPATPQRDVLVRAECFKLTHHVAFTRALAYHDNPDDPVASAAGTFMIFHDDPSTTLHSMDEKGHGHG